MDAAVVEGFMLTEDTGVGEISDIVTAGAEPTLGTGGPEIIFFTFHGEELLK